MDSIQGRCLCGETTVEVDGLVREITVCHCSMCRKQTAGPTFYAQAVSKQAIHFQSDQHVSRYSSSSNAERVFCQKCGTFLYFHEKESDYVHLNNELFNETEENVAFVREIFYKDKQHIIHLQMLQKKKNREKKWTRIG